MTRWAAGLEYLGTVYSGWQAQSDRPSVQAQVEAALSAVADHPIKTQAAGRTDAGVHAAGQVVHFDSDARRSVYAWALGANSQLPRDIGVRWIREVPAYFDARRSAVARRYRYLIHNHRTRSALAMNRAAWITHELDAAAMHRAAQALIGEHDFSAFRAADCQSSTPMREVQEVSVTRRGEYVVLDIRANAFLHHMVRNIAGTLIEIGRGRQPESWTAQLLAAQDRRLAAATAPAYGLYFLGPVYPVEFELPPPVESWLP